MSAILTQAVRLPTRTTDNSPCADCAARGCLPPPSDNSAGKFVHALHYLGFTFAFVDDTSARWYIVTAGLRVGVFAHWYVSFPYHSISTEALPHRSNTAPLVVGVPGAVYIRCPTRAAALEANSVRVIE